MTIQTWGLVPKSQTDPEKVEEAINRIVADHEANPEAHTAENESLSAHRTSEVIDHIARSIVNDKISVTARTYQAILKVPLTDIDYQYPSIINIQDNFTVKNPSGSSVLDILRRTMPHDDTEYVQTNSLNGDDDMLDFTFDTILDDKKITKICFKVRARLVNATLSSRDMGIAIVNAGDPWDSVVSVVPTWQDFQIEMIFDRWNDIKFTPEIVNTLTGQIFVDGIANGNTQNQIQISSANFEISVVADVDYADFYYLPDALAYIQSIGGGNIFIEAGTYYINEYETRLPSNCHIYGHSASDVIIKGWDTEEQIFLGPSTTGDYSTGTVTFTQNSNTVTGSGTSWTSANTLGKYIYENSSGHNFLITEFVDSTHIKIAELYQGQTLSGQTYRMAFMSHDISFNDVTLELVCYVSYTMGPRFEEVIFSKNYLRYSHAEAGRFLSCQILDAAPNQQITYITHFLWSFCDFINCLQTALYLDTNSFFNEISSNLFSNNKQQNSIVAGNYNIIRHNTVLNSGWTLAQNYPAILLLSTSNENIIEGNVVRGCQSWGIADQAGAHRNIYTSNVCRGNGQSGILVNSVDSVSANNIT